MKKIRIKICGSNPNVPLSFGNFIVKSLEKYVNIEHSDNPDYLFTTEASSEYLNHNCIRVFITGENIHPNFNLFDYAVSFDHLQFSDRHFRFPVHQIAIFYRAKDIENAGDLDFKKVVPFTHDEFLKKTDFCSFVSDNYLADPAREVFVKKLSQYKKVNCGGKFMNNIGGPINSKLDFDRKHKFSIAFENSSREGYTTEKIFTSLAAHTIPIYWGDPLISNTFNEKRFINVMAYENFDEAIARIKEIDANDELYLQMVQEPILRPDIDFEKDRLDFEQFLKHIIDQPIEQARRRKINPARKIAMERDAKIVSNYNLFIQKIKKCLAFLYSPFKKIRTLEHLKIKIFQKYGQGKM